MCAALDAAPDAYARYAASEALRGQADSAIAELLNTVAVLRAASTGVGVRMLAALESARAAKVGAGITVELVETDGAPDGYVAAIRTGVDFRYTFHPDWDGAVAELESLVRTERKWRTIVRGKVDKEHRDAVRAYLALGGQCTCAVGAPCDFCGMLTKREAEVYEADGPEGLELLFDHLDDQYEALCDLIASS
jgi:hypothetical protein